MTAVDFDFSEISDLTAFGLSLDPESRKEIANELAARLRESELALRRCEAELLGLLDVADRLGVYTIDGHRNVRAWATATVNWSDLECRDRTRSVHLIRDLPQVGDDLAAGAISVAAVRELARLRANPRCGDRVVDAAAEHLVESAKELPVESFKVVARRWEQLADVDGAHKGDEAAHDGRRVSTRLLATVLGAACWTAVGS